MSENQITARRIPMTSGDEIDALGRNKRWHFWRAGDRSKIKRGYWRRFRTTIRVALKATINE